MRQLLRYLVLPATPTDFERRYLARMNRIALLFFWAHPPVFALVAWMSGTSVWQALVYPAVVLVGPTLAYRAFESPRAISVTYGITAMCMGGLLVHFGQGPMQIEMHFYFFVLIALECVFANPMVIVASAVTVALHHLVLFYVLPRSVFNYDASIWAVVVHAVFVVLESVAAVFVARSFFDSVIGLEGIVRARTRELDGRNEDMRLVLENVGQGFVTIDGEGTLSAERSSALTRWFGAAEAATLPALLRPIDAAFADGLEVGLESVRDGFLPEELSLAQLPRTLRHDGRTWSFEYRSVAGARDRFLVIVSDVTADVARREAEAEGRQLADLLGRSVRDPEGLGELLAEGRSLVETIGDPTVEGPALARAIHTLKGNSAIFGVTTVAAVCHEVESRSVDEGRSANATERAEIVAAWTALEAKIAPFIRTRDEHGVHLSERDVREHLDLIFRGAARTELARRAIEWSLEPAERRFGRIAEQIEATARRLGKDVPEVKLVGGRVRFPRDGWGPFWSSFVHVVRNALDHGLEVGDERRERGKPERGTIVLEARAADDGVEIRLSDDGRGIDWDAIRARATERGLPHETKDELVAALFVDGLTTKAQATEISGRGVGMGALRSSVAELGGTLEIESQPGRGTTISARLPTAAVIQRNLSRIVPGPGSMPPVHA